MRDDPLTGTPLAGLADELDALRAVVTTIEGSDWDRPTRCEGWTVADVLLHLAQTNEFATASLRDEFGPRHAFAAPAASGAPRAAGDDVDAAAAAAVEAQRHTTPAEILARWERSAATMLDAFRARDLHDRVQWVAGTLSARTLVSTRIAETWIHAGDITAALGIEQAPTSRLREIARLAWRTLPYAFARAVYEASGEVGFALIGPDGEEWSFGPTNRSAAEVADRASELTVIRGPALDLCMVAARRLDPGASSLRGTGPDTEAVLRYVRTYA
jgi:uncharacterized protein (TIGR03084 family)